MEDTEKLNKYIHQQIEAGVTPDEIHAQLKSAGWDDATVQSAFTSVQAQVMPTSMQNGAPVFNPNAKQQSFSANGKKRGRIKTSWLLLKQSLGILKNNRGLLRYPLMGLVLNFLITLIVIVIIMASGETLYYEETDYFGSGEIYLTMPGYILVAVYYVFSFFILFMYNAALSAHVLDLFKGKSGHYKDYLDKAWSKKTTIFVYSIISTTVGYILQTIEQRFRLLGFIISRIFGVLWTFANLFTIQVIVENDISAPSAIKQSSKLFISRWGENVSARVTFGVLLFLVYLLIALPLIVVLSIALGAVFNGLTLVLAIVFIFLVLMFVFATIETAASQVLSTALYYYANYNQVPANFSPELLNNSLVPKKKKKGLFGKKVPESN